MSAENDSLQAGMSRRQWLLRLGETTVLVGFSGLLGDLLPTAAALPEPVARVLPPGLYLPSPEHLGHTMATIGVRTPPPGCETEFAPPVVEPYIPAFFTPGEWAAVRSLVRLMLGEVRLEATEATVPRPTPAALSRVHEEVAQWVDRGVAASVARRAAALALDAPRRQLTIAYAGESAWRELLDDPRPDWREGLQWLEGECQRQFATPFIALDAARQAELLRSISGIPGNPPAPAAGQRLFSRLKDAVIGGFYTSQAGLYELGYRGNAYFTESPGCADGQP